MVRYSLTWQNANDHLYDITISFEAPSDETRLLLPAWRPGRYLIQNYAANVRQWSANLRKVEKSVWVASGKAGREVTVHYRFYAGVLDAGSSFLDESEAYFNGSNLFMMVEPLRAEACSLTIGAPCSWRIETQLSRVDGATFEARDYDHLIDSPTICAESMTRHSFVEAGARMHMIFRDDEGLDTEGYVEPVRGIVRAQAAMFGGLPMSEYRFLYHAGDRWHGVEHEDSSSMIVKRSELLGATEQDRGWSHFLSLTSHELFHAWNVKRILPRRFAPYDYMIETPTRLLWAMEGITSYYGELTLVRAGIWSAERYLDHLAEEIETLENSAGRQHLSLAQASMDGWLLNDMHDKPNAWISFYNKGEIVAMLLDLELRSRTTKSLDDVMRKLWEWRVLEEDAIERAVAEVSGEDFAEFFERYVDGTAALPYEEVLGPFGIAFEASAGGQVGLGAKLRSSGGTLIVDAVVRGGAAMEAGLLPGDELIAIGSTRTTGEELLERALRAAGGAESVELLASRGGVVRTRRLPLKPDPHVAISLRLAGEHELRDEWLRSME